MKKYEFFLDEQICWRLIHLHAFIAFMSFRLWFRMKKAGMSVVISLTISYPHHRGSVIGYYDHYYLLVTIFSAALWSIDPQHPLIQIPAYLPCVVCRPLAAWPPSCLATSYNEVTMLYVLYRKNGSWTCYVRYYSLDTDCLGLNNCFILVGVKNIR